MTPHLLMSEVEMRRALVRIAHEIVEQNKGSQNLVLVGLRTRGVPLAQRIADSIASFEGESALSGSVGAIDIGLYRDDLQQLGIRPRLRPSSIPISIEGKTVVLVDDVLYTGRSIRAALDALTDYGRPKRIQLAVLIDRGHRELPIRPDFVGKNVPTTLTVNVNVRVVEVDGRDEVVLEPAGVVQRKRVVSSQ